MPKKSASEKHKPLPNGDFGQIMKNSRSSSGILPLFLRMRQDAAPTGVRMFRASEMRIGNKSVPKASYSSRKTAFPLVRIFRDSKNP
jgi:hypothetical protein